MRNLLRKAGFSVTILENARKKELINAIRSFGRSLRRSDAALFYFSGHGNQYKGLNWLIPIGADIQRESEIEFEAVNTERVLAEMEGDSGKRINIVIFDACRTNSTFRSFRSFNRGLSQPKVQPEGSIVAFSTAPGTVAYDGEGRNSPYVTELSKHMLTPGLKIEDVFKRVRIGVKKSTLRKPKPQITWENSSLMGDFYFIQSSVDNEIVSTSYQATDSTKPTSNSSDTEDQVERVKRLKLTDGTYYTGAFKNNKPHGKKCRFEYPNGDIFVGECKYGGENIKWERWGKYTWRDGDKYTGPWKNGKMHGTGQMRYSNGHTFRGEWRNGERFNGGYTWSPYLEFGGTFKNDKMWDGEIDTLSKYYGIRTVGYYKKGQIWIYNTFPDFDIRSLQYQPSK